VIATPMAPARILVVEDHGDSREAIAHVLRAEGHAVIEASNALEATSTLRSLLIVKKPPDLIITDVYMPGASGLTFLSGVRVIGVTSPVIVITAWPTDDVRARAKRLSGYMIAKPLDLPSLCRTVKAMLQTGSVQRGSAVPSFSSK
jgi:DNA-binding response OmpR family regulator